jgi:dephospho-CoA kinase
MARSGLAEHEVRGIMSAQMKRADRLARADDVLVNDADINTLRSRVAQLHEKYLSEARARP